MSTATKKPQYHLEVEAPSNGRLGKATILAIDAETGKTAYTDKADIASAPERRKAVNRVAEALGVEGEEHIDALHSTFEEKCNALVDQRREQLTQLDPPQNTEA